MPAAGTKLVIVESPTKARTIRQFLGKEYRVEASMGHVRDLPAKADQVPDALRGKPWATLAVDVENDFAPIYVIPPEKKKVVAELRKALSEADELYVATDEDREGESIGWHLVQVLKPKIPTRRMVFHEITPDAIQRALGETREIDDKLVAAQETRRILDRLVGYTVSPMLWKKVSRGLSAGRVQSVAVRLIVLRERERIAFQSGTYWDLKAEIAHPKGAFEAQLTALDGRRIATGKDFDETTGRLVAGSEALLLDGDRAQRLALALATQPFRVADVSESTQTRSPAPPFTTSTLQQEANRKLGFGAKQTMRVAQRLYENGHITYMRTDSVNLSEEAIRAARTLVSSRYGSDYLSPKERRYTTKARGAQEAHEAIRPAGTEMRTADELRLSGEEARLYDMIWKRTVATQMAEARLTFTTARLDATTPEGETGSFRASGRRVDFPGYFRAYVEGKDDPDEALDDQNRLLPALKEGEAHTASRVAANGHETKPPARYTEASLVKALEADGIGRPSTYATIIDTIQERGYVVARNKQLVPTFTAMAVTSMLEETHANIVDVDFTAAMENRLDEMGSAASSRDYLREFYAQIQDGVDSGDDLEARTVCTIRNDRIAPYEIRVGRYGPFVEVPREGEEKALTVSLPEDVAPADVTKQMIDDLAEQAARGDQPLGHDPETGLPVFVLVGRFGPYVQLGEMQDGAKPKRASLAKGMTPEEVNLTTALRLLSLPRLVGTHPETGEEVRAGIGQYGPYVVHQKMYASLRDGDDVLSVGLDRALELLALKAAGGGRGRAAASALRELGAHPEAGGAITVHEGRYGPYVKHGAINATLPKGTDPQAVSLEEAVALIEARRASAPAKPAKKGARGAAAGAAAKKTTDTAAKKTTAKKAAGTTTAKKAAGTTAAKKSAGTGTAKKAAGTGTAKKAAGTGTAKKAAGAKKAT